MPLTSAMKTYCLRQLEPWPI